MAGWDEVLVSSLNLVLNSRFPMCLTWGPEHLLFHNDAYDAVLRGKGACQGQPMQVVFPEAWALVEPILQRARVGNASYFEDLEIPLLRNAQLEETWWSFSYSPILLAEGAPGGVLGVVYETTRRFLAEQALWSREAALRVVTDMAPAMLWRCDAWGRLTWVNQELQTFLGEDGLEQMRLQDCFHPDEAASLAEIEAACRETRKPFEGQARLKGALGDYRWFLIRAQQIWEGDGRFIGWCGSAVDIEDWRVAAEGVTDRDELVREFSGAETTMMWTADVASRRVQGLNPHFRSAWALPASGESVSWDEWVQLVHPDDQAQMAGALDLIAAGETMQGKFRAPTADGGLRWFHATAFPIRGPGGVIARIGGLLVDVTSDTDPRVYLIDADAAAQNRLTHAFTRSSFKVRSFDDVAAFAKLSDDLVPGVVVLASDRELGSLIKAAGVLGVSSARLPWIAVGSFDHQLNEVVQLMKLGAANVLPASTPPEAIVQAARAALPSDGPRSRESSRGPSGARNKIAELSRREREVLDGLARGGTNKTIAQSLSLSPRTVETYRAQLMDRLGVRTLADLLKLAADAA
ncbi:PAS domain-containing protein [Brevundimonas sp.]|jgi:PAS domain S-box-containing protein|uniref:PAS domain-containing protein n=1 Tax=Brevundimonas sp. TaxID=1871086 RepID=UPI0037BF024D